jgi:hypothetical protein
MVIYNFTSSARCSSSSSSVFRARSSRPSRSSASSSSFRAVCTHTSQESMPEMRGLVVLSSLLLLICCAPCLEALGTRHLECFLLFAPVQCMRHKRGKRRKHESSTSMRHIQLQNIQTYLSMYHPKQFPHLLRFRNIYRLVTILGIDVVSVAITHNHSGYVFSHLVGGFHICAYREQPSCTAATSSICCYMQGCPFSLFDGTGLHSDDVFLCTHIISHFQASPVRAQQKQCNAYIVPCHRSMESSRTILHCCCYY